MDSEKIEVQEAEAQNSEIQNSEIQNSELQQNEEKTVDTQKVEKPKKKKKIVLIIIIVLLLLLIAGAAIFYWRVAVYYQTHFFPNTTVNDFDCSELEAAQVTLMVESEILDYRMEVTGRLNEEGDLGPLGEITAEDIDLQYLGTAEAINHLLEQQNEWMWIETLTNTHYSHNLQQGVGFDEDKLKSHVESWDAFQDMKEPKDAYISEYSQENGYEIIPESMGTQIQEASAIEYIKNAILMKETAIDLEEMDCYEKPQITADDEKLNESVNEINKWLSTEITYDWNGTEVIVDKELISQWASLEDNEPKLDEEAVAEFVAEQAGTLDTFGKYYNFTTALGGQINLLRASYGWQTDKEGETEALIQLIYRGSTEEREPVFIRKGRWKGVNDIGNSYVEADLTNQHLYLYWQGTLVLETDFVSGEANVPGNRTPPGIFGITYKTTNAVLRGADYETPVTYWMPFYGNFGMHDASWRTEFGGDIYLTNGSHGCLNLPPDQAAIIYNYMSEGFPVICYYY